MKGYGQFCPVAKTAEIFAQRWTPLILRELCLGPQGFNDLLRALPLVSRGVLALRLSELAAAGVITAMRRKGGRSLYSLTPAGEDFRPIIQLMSRWGQVWGQGSVTPADLDPVLLIWALRRRIDRSLLPEDTFVIQFEFTGVPKAKRNQRYWWLVLRRPLVEVCLKNPGYAVDVTVIADLATFTRVWLGYEGHRAAGRALALQGSRKAVLFARSLLDLQPQPLEKTFSYGPLAPEPSEEQASGLQA